MKKSLKRQQKKARKQLHKSMSKVEKLKEEVVSIEPSNEEIKEIPVKL